ncbi:PhoH family protein [Alphaproteobacteria bacterium]|nr:PhoH family protein [Alphaproteobacteria bacterium]MBT5798237.1 PhoH family protein [Alphaproteobacteria bacterium]MDA9190183.1 PhoH family protein [Alphaproteobacteria bacterium]MDC3311064.1 PhoH family protein [Alphaproteobacteria bacterium]
MASDDTKSVRLSFDDNDILLLLCGQHNVNLAKIEKTLDVSIDSFGNELRIKGDAEQTKTAGDVIQRLFKQLATDPDPKSTASGPLIDDILRLVEYGHDLTKSPVQEQVFAATWRKKIFARTKGQSEYFNLMRKNEVVFGLGPAGTGKTYMAVAMAVDHLKAKKVEKLILSRPAVEAGERLGFLPGDMKEKVDPYLRPLYDALYDMMPADKVERMIANGEIEIAPLAFMRGRTLSNAFVIIDEAQNTTSIQMKMVLTRLGQDSRMVITGDLSQVDLPSNQLSGLADATARLRDIEGVGIYRLTGEDVVRHPIVARILKAYDSD